MEHNTSRVLAVDFARGLGIALHLIGKGTSAILLAMGISFMLARDHNLWGAIKRVRVLLAMAYFMNALKFLVPIVVFGREGRGTR